MLLTTTGHRLQKPAGDANGTGDNGTREIAKLFPAVLR